MLRYFKHRKGKKRMAMYPKSAGNHLVMMEEYKRMAMANAGDPMAYWHYCAKSMEHGAIAANAMAGQSNMHMMPMNNMPMHHMSMSNMPMHHMSMNNMPKDHIPMN
jgi:hypothetical protein